MVEPIGSSSCTTSTATDVLQQFSVLKLPLWDPLLATFTFDIKLSEWVLARETDGLVVVAVAAAAPQHHNNKSTNNSTTSTASATTTLTRELYLPYGMHFDSVLEKLAGQVIINDDHRATTSSSSSKKSKSQSSFQHRPSLFVVFENRASSTDRLVMNRTHFYHVFPALDSTSMFKSVIVQLLMSSTNKSPDSVCSTTSLSSSYSSSSDLQDEASLLNPMSNSVSTLKPPSPTSSFSYSSSSISSHHSHNNHQKIHSRSSTGNSAYSLASESSSSSFSLSSSSASTILFEDNVSNIYNNHGYFSCDTDHINEPLSYYYNMKGKSKLLQSSFPVTSSSTELPPPPPLSSDQPASFLDRTTRNSYTIIGGRYYNESSDTARGKKTVRKNLHSNGYDARSLNHHDQLDNSIMLVEVETGALTSSTETVNNQSSSRPRSTTVLVLLQFKLIGWSMADVLSCTLSSSSALQRSRRSGHIVVDSWEEIPLNENGNSGKSSMKTSGIKFLPKFKF